MKKIIPNLWFQGNAEEAIAFYLSVFKGGKVLSKAYYPIDGLADFQKKFAGQVISIDFELLDQRFVAINAGPEFSFNEAISFAIFGKDQEEIDYYWNALVQDGGAESVCGWLKDKYGLSWQVHPHNIDELVKRPGGFEKMMKMKKIIIADFH